MSIDQLPKAPVDPTDEVAERLQASFGISKDGAETVTHNIGGEVHEVNAPVEQMREINDEVAIRTSESFMPEDRETAGISRDELERLILLGRDGVYKSEGVKVPESVSDEQKVAYKKMAEGAILRGMLSAADVRSYNAAVEAVAPVAMLHSRDDQENKRTSAVQVVRFNKQDGSRGQVEIVRNYDDEANETGLFIRAS